MANCSVIFCILYKYNFFRYIPNNLDFLHARSLSNLGPASSKWVLKIGAFYGLAIDFYSTTP